MDWEPEYNLKNDKDIFFYRSSGTLGSSKLVRLSL